MIQKSFYSKSLLLALFLLCNVGSSLHAEQLRHLEIERSLSQLLGETNAKRYAKIIKSDKLIQWQIYFPENESREKPGVLVYVSPHKSGDLDPRWQQVLDAENLIFVSANNSGNKTPTDRRMVMATMSLRMLSSEHVFDINRVYVAGFSGGGRVASLLATQYPDVFKGALYICGVDFWKKSQTPKLDRVLKNRFVFLTGSGDFNLMETKNIYRRYLKAGANQSTLMVVKNLAHELPGAGDLAEALSFLGAQKSGSEING